VHPHRLRHRIRLEIIGDVDIDDLDCVHRPRERRPQFRARLDAVLVTSFSITHRAFKGSNAVLEIRQRQAMRREPGGTNGDAGRERPGDGEQLLTVGRQRSIDPGLQGRMCPGQHARGRGRACERLDQRLPRGGLPADTSGVRGGLLRDVERLQPIDLGGDDGEGVVNGAVVREALRVARAEIADAQQHLQTKPIANGHRRVLQRDGSYFPCRGGMVPDTPLKDLKIDLKRSVRFSGV
jgi:hypothetical protein